MAVTFNSHAAVTADSHTVSTGSITPTSGVPYLISVFSYDGAQPTITGTNGWNTTWSLIGGNSGGTVSLPSSSTQLVWMYVGVPVSGTAGVLTATGESSVTLSIAMFVTETNGNTSGTIVQSEEGTVSNGTVVGATLSSFASSNNGTYIVAFCTENRLSSFVADSPLSQLAETAVFFNVYSGADASNTGNDTTPSISWTESATGGCLAVEVAASASGVTISPGVGSEPLTGRTLGLGLGIGMPDQAMSIAGKLIEYVEIRNTGQILISPV